MKYYKVKGVSECCVDCNEETQNLAITDTLPLTFTGDPKFVFITVSNTIELDLTGWAPTGLCTGSILRFQKINSNNKRIIYNDGNVNYRYINKKGEVITLVLSKNSILEII